jgi:hypothetical protein
MEKAEEGLHWTTKWLTSATRLGGFRLLSGCGTKLAGERRDAGAVLSQNAIRKINTEKWLLSNRHAKAVNTITVTFP